VNALGYTSVRWSVDTWGWMGPTGGQSVGTVVRRFEQRLRPGAIVLMHLGAGRDGSLLDAHALKQVITVAKRRGYRFVMLDRWVRPPK
jgi:peptidoglycan/xylan/chitin deacetylase (PgdA/CDA1 family)